MVVTKNTGEKKAVCKHCKIEYDHDSHKNGTNTYRMHRTICSLTPRPKNICNILLAAEAKLQARKI